MFKNGVIATYMKKLDLLAVTGLFRFGNTIWKAKFNEYISPLWKKTIPVI